ncbi:hemerythrin domain-containing protein [Ruminiclostridium josui]|uniref:hemerythrin domain-containing protein n=1 Tax=Ruminiclostridium josui TaxID=1499 RepID=UPI0004672938|nr:hemerythrin domain-containing protein [Ruminiclostridium josui]
MIYLETLKRQHEEIAEILSDIKFHILHKDIAKEALEISSKISNLAGKLKVHLNTEDQYMYPQLLKSSNSEIRKTAQAYIDEMGTISTQFMAYKDRFNTRSKITNDIDLFVSESKKIFDILEQRIAKENSNLYQEIEI